ncbi:hypothetical protein C2869_07685 [Saccharobesus litoralis]|uniref:TonB-dependent receptor n=1 Tax=Saccharobesus litoralis TaxID=2172099 RepID=A0A2S0VQF5_9ALTE|nr:TonB-dependent receptor [Saccharobesus litoralis]AWB66320.1 hypothetical protein C2869_07685 [Saccharobesus litoralis]
MFKQNPLAKHIRLSLLASLAISYVPLSYAQEATADNNNNQNQQEAEDTEVISVTGVRNSLRDAAFLKKSAEQIMDAIAAEDIGQLPDNNIAEALQRVTGLQIGRDDTGAGSNFQVRGLSQNRVEVNGQSMASADETRSASFNNVDSALFKAIEVYKSPTADMVEGAIGATIRLKTFKPLDKKNGFVNLNVQGTQDDLVDDTGSKISLAAAERWDSDSIGQFGILFNVSNEERFAETHEMKTNWSPALTQQIDNNRFLNGSLRPATINAAGERVDLLSSDASVPYAAYRPEDLELASKGFEQTNLSIDTTIQWAPTEDLEITLFGQTSDFERIATDQVMKYGTRHQDNEVLDYDLIATERNDTPTILGAWTRPAQSFEYQKSQEYVNALALNSPLAEGLAYYVPVLDPVERYIVQSATVSPTGSPYHAPVASQYSSSISNTKTNTYSLGFKYFINDGLSLEAKYAFSEAKSDNDGIAQRLSPGTTTTDTAANSLAQAYTYYDFSPTVDLPEFGVIAVDSNNYTSRNLSEDLNNPSLYALHNGWGFLTQSTNQKDELSLDFDWNVDGNFITKVEFGARFANNHIKRSKQELKFINFGTNSIFSTNWRAYDRDLSVRPQGEKVTGNDKIALEFAEQVMAEEYGIDNYFSRHLTLSPKLFPNTDGANFDQWMTFNLGHNDFKQLLLGAFPGRAGDCLIFDKDASQCNTELYEFPDAEDVNSRGYNEFDHVLTIPKAQYVKDGSYPYLITEETRALYGKVNFENEVFTIPVSGNFGVRYVETETTSLGVHTTRFLNDEDKQLKDLDGLDVEQYDPLYFTNEYSNLLPSLNVNFLVTDDMFIRVAMAKTMSRPNPTDLSPSLDLPNYSWTAKLGNPGLEPQEATNFDFSWEWYINDTNTLSAAIFAKELENFLTLRHYTIFSPADRNGDGDFRNDPVTVSQPFNGGDGKIKGIELAALHTFDYLPGFLSGFGVQANYTFTDSSQDSGSSQLDGSTLPVFNLSQDSYNLSVFYDKYGFNFRAAYNYRTENLNGSSTAGTDPQLYVDALSYEDPKAVPSLGIQLPEWNDEFATLDLSASYKYKNVRVYLQARNVLSEANRRYVGDMTTTKHILSRYQETGANYVAGVSVNF